MTAVLASTEALRFLCTVPKANGAIDSKKFILPFVSFSEILIL